MKTGNSDAFFREKCLTKNSYDLLARMLSYLNIPADSILTSDESDLTPEQEQLLYLVKHKCNQRDISVLLSTAEALVNTKE